MFTPVKSIQTVSEFTSSLKGLIETSHPFTHLQGEVSNLRIPYSGHMYFILKDNHAQIRAVLFKGQRRFLSEDFKDGDAIICRGRVTVYEPRGDYQIIVDSVEKAGRGSMHIQFAALKKKLQQEGLFNQELKKTLPLFPQKICLITSSSGAAVHDFLKIALKRHPRLQVEIMPTPMQGESAPKLIQLSLEQINRRSWAEVIFLCRGGGSIEDLWAFNDENVARAISNSKIPVVAAIGHEVDYTISDFVADLRAPTPTAAAQLVIPNIQQLKEIVVGYEIKITKVIKSLLKQSHQDLKNQVINLGDPRSILNHQQLKTDYLVSKLELAFSNHVPIKKDRLGGVMRRLARVTPTISIKKGQQQLKELQDRLLIAQKNTIQRQNEHLQQKALMLNALSPLAVLARGYGITTESKTNKLVTSVKNITKQDILTIKLHDGSIVAKTIKIQQDPKKQTVIK